MSFDSLMQAKAARDAVRAAIVHELSLMVGLPEEIQALLAADVHATAEFNDVVRRQQNEEQADRAEGIRGERTDAGGFGGEGLRAL